MQLDHFCNFIQEKSVVFFRNQSRVIWKSKDK